MMFGVLIARAPPTDWKPAGWVPTVNSGNKMIATASVTAVNAIKTPQLWFLWGVLCLNVTAGIGVLSQASPMIQEVFSDVRMGVGFATVPACLRDMFGTLQVGAIHGRLLTTWSTGAMPKHRHLPARILHQERQSDRAGRECGQRLLHDHVHHGIAAGGRAYLQPAGKTRSREMPNQTRRKIRNCLSQLSYERRKKYPDTVHCSGLDFRQYPAAVGRFADDHQITGFV